MSFDLKILEGNLLIGSNGDLGIVENSEKLIQDVLKIAITPLNSNKFQPGYGSPLSNTLIGNVLPMDFLVTTAATQLRNSLEFLQKLQKIQMNRQVVSASEQLAGVQDVQIRRNQTDPRFFDVLIKCLTREFSIINAQLRIDPL